MAGQANQGSQAIGSRRADAGQRPATVHQVTALIHTHTTASDGAATTEQVATEAARAGVEVVILTDHDQLSPHPGWHGPVLVLAGVEVSPRRNHILAVGLDKAPPLIWGPVPGEEHNGAPAASLAHIAASGGFSVLAHLLDPPLADSPDPRSFSATDFSAIDSNGLELINAVSAFKRGATTPFGALSQLCMPRTFLPGPHRPVMALWDTVGRRRPWVGIGGADAHAFASGRAWLPVKVFSYRRHMRLVTTLLWLDAPLTGDLAQDQALVVEALKRGRCCAAVGRARGFDCRLHGVGGGPLLPGAELAWRPGLGLRASLPARGLIRLIKNGRVVQEARGRGLERELEGPGVWRVEARRWRPPAGYRPWIYCNPFYLRAEAI